MKQDTLTLKKWDASWTVITNALLDAFNGSHFVLFNGWQGNPYCALTDYNKTLDALLLLGFGVDSIKPRVCSGYYFV